MTKLQPPTITNVDADLSRLKDEILLMSGEFGLKTQQMYSNITIESEMIKKLMPKGQADTQTNKVVVSVRGGQTYDLHMG